MIQALEVVIQYLKRSGLSTAQIASKTHYGEVWPAGSSSVVVRQDGGILDLYIEIQTVRLEVRCFATNELAALGLAGEIHTLSRQIQREAQPVTGGETGLLYRLIPASSPSVLFDQDIKMWFALQFYEAAVAEISI